MVENELWSGEMPVQDKFVQFYHIIRSLFASLPLLVNNLVSFVSLFNSYTMPLFKN